MFKNNNIYLGIVYGLVMPVLIWLVFSLLLKNDGLIMDKPAVPYLIAIALNLLLLRFTARRHLDKTSNGIMVATFACTILIFLFKIHGS